MEQTRRANSNSTKRSKSITRALVILTFFAFTLLSPTATNADPLTLIINPTSLTGVAGGTITFMGTITNTTGIDLNATDLFLNFSGFEALIVTPTQLLGDPDFLLPDGTSSAAVALFSITLDPTAIVGNTYSLDVFLQDINNNFSNMATVSVRVNAAPIPEPTTLLLLSTGFIGSVALTRKRRRILRRWES